MELIYNVLGKGIHITKRDLFYTDVKLFVKQADSDGVLDDISTMIGCTRSNLNVVASDKGLVVGRVQFTEVSIRKCGRSPLPLGLGLGLGF